VSCVGISRCHVTLPIVCRPQQYGQRQKSYAVSLWVNFYLTWRTDVTPYTYYYYYCNYYYYYYYYTSWDSSVGTDTWLWIGLPGVRIPAMARDFLFSTQLPNQWIPGSLLWHVNMTSRFCLVPRLPPYSFMV
jgi:hypothetical protein